MGRRSGALIGSLVLLAAAAPLAHSGAVGAATTLGPADWRTYGGGAHHSFSVKSGLTATNVQTLKPKWFFPTGDSVTANPVKVGNRVYVGSWDGNFYAINATTGKQAWKFKVDAQPAVHPLAGESTLDRLRDVSSDGGIITSSAWFEPANATAGTPDLVIFGGGYTLYALNAATGQLFWKHPYPGTGVGGALHPTTDGTRIFSSPVVIGDQIVFGVAVDGDPGLRGYLQSANLATGNPRWTFDTDVDVIGGPPTNDGCGSVWSSPSYDEVNHVVVSSVSDCDFKAVQPFGERVFAVNVGGSAPDGTLAWRFTPPRLLHGDPPCDFDFGASANLGVLKGTGRRVATIGGKDGTIYVLDSATGALVHSTNVVFGGEAGGFIGTTAFDGARVYGATSLGDFPAEVVLGEPGGACAPLNPGDNALQEPSVHAVDARTGKVTWESVLSQSFGATTVSGGLVFSAPTFFQRIDIRNAANGLLVKVLPAPSGSASGITVSGTSLYYGTGVFLPGPLVDGVYAWGI